jgi:O-antigen ligase
VSGLLSTALAVVVAAFVFVWLLRHERANQSIVSLTFVLGLVIVEAAVYPSPDTIPAGLFHPGGGGLTFRLVDVLIPVALLARVVGRGPPRRIDAAALWWVAFLFWLAVAAVQGLDEGNPAGLVAFEAKAIVSLGVFALAAGVPLEEYLSGRRFERFVYPTAGLAALLVFTDQANLRVDSGIPILPLQQFGEVGSDAATLFGTVGVFAAAVGATRERGRIGLLIASTPLLVSVAAAGQRAALLGVVVALGVLVVLALMASRNIRATPTEIGLTLTAAVGVLLVPFVVGAVIGKKAPEVALSKSVTTALASQEKALSAASRAEQWRVASDLVGERPVFGWGLGKTYVYYDPGPKQFLETKLTHNIGLDLLVRTGLVGLTLFVVALAWTFVGGVRTWFAHDIPPEVAAFALAAVASLAGLLAKGMVESLFEKYRLGVLMGLLAGILLSAASSRQRVPRAAPVRAQTAPPAFES